MGAAPKMKRKSQPEPSEQTKAKKVRFDDAKTVKKTTEVKTKTRVKDGKVTKPNTFKKHDNRSGKNGNHSKFNKGSKETTKPPDWSKFKKEKKIVRTARREAGIGEDMLKVISQVKVIHEKLRRKKNSPDERLKLTNELHTILSEKGNYKQLALAHDTSRIIQWLLKFGSETVRAEASKELIEITVEMIQSKYARNSVKRILKYGSAATRNDVICSLFGNVIKLASHTLSAPILDYIYTEIANKKQKQQLQQEFYGDLYKTNKDDSVKSLEDTYKKSPEMKSAMLGATKSNLLRVLNKNVHDCGLVHAVLYEFLKESNATERSEMITTISPLVAPLSNSKLGVKAAIMCLWHGTNKDRKTMLKVLKDHILSLAVHEHGHLLILSILASVDDTVLVNKVLLSALLKDVKSMAKEEWGRKVLLWLVAPEDKAYFHPTFAQWLKEGISQGNSKKPAEQRTAELLKDALPILCKSIQEDTEFWLSNGSLSLTALAIIKTATSTDLQVTLDCISEYICSPEWMISQDSGENISGIEHPGLHLTLKKLAQCNKINSEKSEYTFGESIVKVLNNDVVTRWITMNRGCFLLVSLFENNSTEVQKSLKKILKPNLDKMKKQTTAGAKILVKKLT